MADGAAEPARVEIDGNRISLAAKRRLWLTRLALVVAGAAVLWLVWYLLVGRNYVSTDNAYVNAELAQVTPQISAKVVEVRAKDTQHVKAGELLLKLDPETARIAVAEAEADLAEARRQFHQTIATSGSLSARVASRSAELSSAQAQLDAAKADFEKARIDLKRREALAGSGAVSGEEITSARKALASASAALSTARAGISLAQANRNSAQSDLAANQALVAGSTVETDPGVMAAKAKLRDARLDLDNAVIRAPIGGVIAKRTVQVGQRVEVGKPIMTIVPVDKVYIDANFKEGQLRRVKIGMPATVTADLYGGSVTYHGKVVGISGGTGASMSLIPAQNATGNWIKVVQRLPVRIELDPKDLVRHPLRVGLSTEVEIDISGG